VSASRHNPDSAKAAAPDRALLLGVSRREPAALEKFFDLYYDRIFAHVARLLQDQHQAEDLTHEIFLHLNKTLDRLDPDRDPTGWVFTVATNCVRDYWRSRGHKDTTRSVGLDTEHLEVLADDTLDAEQQLAQRQERDVVRTALLELPDRDREVILLRDYENLDTADVATVIGAKPDAVRQRHSRAVTRLGEIFKRLMKQEQADS